MNQPLRLSEPLLAFEPPTPALTQALQRLDEMLPQFRAQRDNGGLLPNTIEAIRVELTYHSNAIEGNTLSLRETQMVLEGSTPASAKSLREVYEVRNHHRALRLIEHWAASRPAPAAITERDLLDVHAIILADIDPSSAVRFRSERVLIKGSGFVPPGSHRFAELIPALLERANQFSSHPGTAAAELHYSLAAVHPFRDGNGRAARLFMNYHLLRSGYPLTIIEVQRRAEYLAALEHADSGRWEHFALFIAGCVERSLERIAPGTA